MQKPKVEWDPSWDDDWKAAQEKLEQEIEDEHPLDPEQAVELYRYGFVEARRHPTREWSDVESKLYQDYMGGAPEPGEWQGEETGWEQARVWAHHGWEIARYRTSDIP